MGEKSERSKGGETVRTLILLLVAPIFLAAQPAAPPMSPDQFYASLQAVLANVTSMRTQIIAQQTQIADLTAKLAAANASCMTVPTQWIEMLQNILAAGNKIAGIAYFPRFQADIPSPVDAAVKP